MNRDTFRKYTKLARPLLLLDSALMYILGVGIARYLGVIIDTGVFSQGLVWVLSLQLGVHFLYGYFAQPPAIEKKKDNDDTGQRLRREIPLWLGITSLTITTSFTLVLLRSGVVDGAVYLVMGLLLLGSFISVVPPFCLVDSPYRVIILSIMLANFIPALAYMLQENELHRLLTMTTFPLTLLHFAMLLALEFQGYAADLKQARPTLLVRLGWPRGMRLINILILSGYLLLGVAMLFGLPLNLALPAFFVLPLALFLIWYLTRIAEGAKPHWIALNAMAILVYGLTTYLLAFSFWTR
jgi:1,4-dihydroxy-2-naphthoate octaprenyltransferase